MTYKETVPAVTGTRQGRAEPALKAGMRAPLVLVWILLGCGGTAFGQGLASVLATGTGTAAATAPTDELGRDTPRSSIFEFLKACHAANFVRAARYLDLDSISVREQVQTGPERARQLAEVLDRDPLFELAQLDNTPDGRMTDDLAGDMDHLTTLTEGGNSYPLYMIRVKKDKVPVWLVSPDSVQRIPELAALLGPTAIEKRMPAPLVRLQWLGTPVWVWLGLTSIAVLLALLSSWLSRFVLFALTPIAKRYVKTMPLIRLNSFTEPLRLVLGVLVFRACLPFFPPGALLRDLFLKVIALLFVFGCAAVIMRIVDVISDIWISRLNPREKAMSYSVLPLGVRFAKICLFFLGVLVILRYWGVDITALLAGVGVGGLALALAAQKTIENLFGGVSVISDRPVLVGDLCQFGGQFGVVEDIGLRSTRIRTLERTVVTVPNSQFSSMTLENYSRRERFWFHPAFLLHRRTTVAKIQEAMDAIVAILKDHPKVDPTGVPVRFTKIAPEGFTLEVFSYVLTADGDEFERIRSELNLGFLQSFARIGVELGMPLQENIAFVSEVAATESGKTESISNAAVEETPVLNRQ